MKVLKRIILAGIALVLILSLGAYFAIKVAFPPGKIKDLIHTQGTKALNRDVTVDDVSIRIIPNLRLSISNITVANSPGYSQESCIKLQELSLSINFLSLLKFAPVINEIKLVEPEILYEVAKNGHNNLEGIGKNGEVEPPQDSTKKLESPAAVALKSFVIEKGRVRYRDLKSGQILTLENIKQRVSLNLDPRLENIETQGLLEITGIMVSDSASGVRKGDISVSVKHDISVNLPGERIQIRTLELGFQDIKVSVNGEASQFMTKPPVLDLSISAPNINLASILKEIPPQLSPELSKLSVAGIAAFDVKVKGAVAPPSLPMVTAKFTIKEGSVAHNELAAGIEKFNMELGVMGDSVHLSQFGFLLGGNPVSMDALITSYKDSIPMLNGFNLNALLDLGKIIPLAQKFSLVDKTLKAEGTIEAKVNASGLLDPTAPQNLQAKGQIILNNLNASGKPIPKPVKVAGEVNIDNAQILENLKIQIGESDLSISGSVINYLAMVIPKQVNGVTTKAKLNIQSNLLNLDELKPESENKSNTESAPMTAFPTLPKLDAEVTVKLAKTRIMNIDLTQFSSQTTLLASVITTAMKGTLYSGGFTSSMRANLKDTSNADVSLKLDVAKVEANDFISRLNDNLPTSNRIMKSFSKSDSMLYGKFNLNMDVKTHGLPQTMADNLTGKINFEILDGKIMETGMVKGLSDALGKVHKSLAFRELSFSNFSTELEAQSGRLLVKDCKIEKTIAGSIDATGSIGFDNTLDLNLESHLPPGVSQAVTGASGALASEVAKMSKIPALGNVSLVPVDKSGRAVVYFLVGGILSSPTFGLDSKRMASEAGAGVKSALTDALNKKKEELKARLDSEKAKLESEAKARIEEEKKKIQTEVDAKKQQATDEAKKQGKKVLKGFGL